MGNLQMINFRDEGQKVKNGLNFYPHYSKFAGVVIRFRQKALWAYFSKRENKFHFSIKNIDEI